MAKTLYHLTDKGPLPCSSTKGKCPYRNTSEHFDSLPEATKAWEEILEDENPPKTLKRRKVAAETPATKGFGLENGGYYGELPPRTIQIEALNATAEALLEDGNTQLVAACGTGKSYMGRQLMRRMMDEEGANGVSIVLTSSRKLAIDTAADLRPDAQGNYDQAIGVYGTDYEVEVIEIHSDSKDGIKENGAVSPERIAERWRAALDAGKKVVIVSTYQSSDKVQQVQELIGERAEADLLMNDEAHNILGQKTSSSADTEAENAGYRSFVNEIPGAIQAKHRLYATATPALADSPDDEETSAQGATRVEQLTALREQAQKMKANGRERLTIYSDDQEIVGRVSGVISQGEAIDHGYLTRPEYQLRGTRVSVTDANDFVDASGHALGAIGASSPMTAQTYAAISATLSAMTEDPKLGESGKFENPVHNALLYAGSIAQATAAKDNFRAVALEQSEGISLEDAQLNYNVTTDPELRRRARLRLLAEYADTQVAHSKSSVEEKKKAFSMFRGKPFGEKELESGWTPHKRLLSNVDIFSEGVSLNEIDTVVIADQAKTSERAMTQAIGRSLRTIRDNDVKSVGHVIIPQVIGPNGKELNGALTTAAAYGATRVERAVSVRKLKNEPVLADEKTTLATFDADGKPSGNKLASSVAKEHIKSSEDFLASQVIERAHRALLSRSTPERREQADRYKELSANERMAAQRSYIEEQASSTRTADPSWAVAHNTLENVRNSEFPTLRQSGRVVTSALSAGDFSAVPSGVIRGLTQAGIVRPRASRSPAGLPRPEEQEKLLLANADSIAMTLGSPRGQSVAPALAAKVLENADYRAALRYGANPRNGGKEKYDEILENFSRKVKSDPEFREEAFSLISRLSATPSRSGSKVTVDSQAADILRQWDNRRGFNITESLAQLNVAVKDRSASEASAGETGYELDSGLVSSNGTLKAAAQRNLSNAL